LLAHLRDTGPMLYDLPLTVHLNGTEVCRTNYSEMYYSAAQQLAHHASCGCPLRVGDLLGSGTISGPERGNRGSLLELTWGGKEPVTLRDGTTRSFLQDGDIVTIQGAARGSGHMIGFGPCSGTIVPAQGAPASAYGTLDQKL
jgi:fumarylacetoacetase